MGENTRDNVGIKNTHCINGVVVWGNKILN